MKKNKLEIKHWSVMILIILALSIIKIASATPNSMNIQGKLTSNGGSILAGTYNFTFRIYDNSTAGSMLYETNLSLTTDSRGVYDAILTNINLPFNKQYYLAVKVMSDSEMQPRVNLTSVPYSFKANESEGLNTSKDATVNGNVNISASGNINALGTITGDVLNSISQLNVAGGFSNGGLTIGFNSTLAGLTSSFVRLNNLTTTTIPDCSYSIEGMVAYNSSAGRFLGCNGTVWARLNI